MKADTTVRVGQSCGELRISNLKFEMPERKSNFPAVYIWPLVIVALMSMLIALPALAGERLLGPGDKLSVTVWGEKELSREVEVRQDGKIALPLAGEIAAVGLDTERLAEQITERLGNFLRHPRVEVSVTTYADLAVYVLGQVNRPGAYQVPRGGGVMELIALAGGLLPTADKEASLLRADRTLVTVKLDSLVDAARAGDAPQLEPGDVLIVPFRRQAEQIAIMGQVSKPGMYPFTPGMRVLEVVGLAGIDETKKEVPTRPDLTRVLLTRGGENRVIDLARMLKSGELQENELLAPGDIVTIPEAARKRIYTFGAFRSPGVRYLDPGEGLLEAILASGGPLESAQLDHATLVRVVAGQTKTTRIDLRRLISRGDFSQNLPLENGDIVFLPGPQKNALRLESVMPFIPYLLF